MRKTIWAAAQLGTVTTGADGSFRFSATLPQGWQDLTGFNVELAYDGDDTHRPDSVTMRPKGSVDAPGQQTGGETSDTGATGEQPADAKDAKGGLAKTGA